MGKGKVAGDGLHAHQRRIFLSLRMWFNAASLRDTDTSNVLSESPHRSIVEDTSPLRRSAGPGQKSMINAWRHEVGRTWKVGHRSRR